MTHSALACRRVHEHDAAWSAKALVNIVELHHTSANLAAVAKASYEIQNQAEKGYTSRPITSQLLEGYTYSQPASALAWLSCFVLSFEKMRSFSHPKSPSLRFDEAVMKNVQPHLGLQIKKVEATATAWAQSLAAINTSSQVIWPHPALTDGEKDVCKRSVGICWLHYSHYWTPVS